MKHLKRLKKRPLALPFFCMADKRKRVHSDTCRYAREHGLGFLEAVIPYASQVEQMTVRREPLPAFAPRCPASAAYARLWNEIGERLEGGERGSILERRGVRRELLDIARGRMGLGGSDSSAIGNRE